MFFKAKQFANLKYLSIMKNMKEEFKPEISVCIPIWNVEGYVERCLRSVFEQTIADKAEFILVNDCTPDHSMDIVQKVIQDYPHLIRQIKIINHEFNKGLASARNTALDNALGKYLINVDSDDWCEPDYLEVLYTTAEAENADIVGCNLLAENINGQTKITVFLDPDNEKNIKNLLKGILPGWLHIKFFKRSLFQNIRWVEGLDIMEDTLICIKLFTVAYKTVHVNKYLYHYEQTNVHSLTSQYTLDKYSKEKLEKLVENINEFFLSNQLTYKYKEELISRKIFIKIWALSNSKKKRKEYHSLFKGIHKAIKPTSLKNVYHWFLLGLYDWHLSWLGDFIIDAKKKINKSH